MTDDHRHCKNCGRTCPPDEETCSVACQEVRDRRARQRQMYTYLLYGTAALLLVLLLSHELI